MHWLQILDLHCRWNRRPGGYNKIPQTQCLKAIEMYCLTVLDSKKSKIKVLAGPSSLWNLLGNPSLPLPSFWQLLTIFGIPGLAAV